MRTSTPSTLVAVGGSIHSMADGSPSFDQDALETILESLLSSHPDAFVAAIDPGPLGRFVPIPESLPLRGQTVLEASTALDIVVPADRVVIIDSWELARAVGVARASIRLAVDPDASVTIHYVDARARHGVYVAFVVSDSATGERLAARPDVTPLPPRIGHARKSELAVILDTDEALLRILGWTAEAMIGHRSLEFIHPDDQELAIRDWMQLLDTPGRLASVRQRHRRADGTWAWLEVTNDNRLADPAVGAVLTELIDVTHEMAAQEALRAREQLLHRLAEALPIGVLQATADRRVVYTNERLHRILGTPLRVDLADQLEVVDPIDTPALAAAVDAALGDGTDGDLEVRVHADPASGDRTCLVRVRSLEDELGTPTGAILTFEDITESSRLRTELERRATHDTLTGTLNRASILAYLDRALAGRAISGTAVIFVDLDRFKQVNDELGHATGDELLRVVAGRLAKAVRAGDALGRIGGDEFLVVCSPIQGVSAARRVAARLSRALQEPVRLAAATLDVRASLGVAFAGRRPTSADALVAQADAAMYESKRAGICRPVVFSQESSKRVRVA